MREQRHLEAAACHAELLHGLRDGGGQLRRGRAARGRHALGFDIERRECVFQREPQAVDVGRRVDGVQLAAPLRQQRRQLGGRAPVAARQTHPRRQAMVQSLQPVGLGLGVVQVAGQRVRGVLQLRLRALQHLDGGCELRVERGHFFERMHRPPRQRIGVVIGLGDGIERAAHCLDQRLRIRQPFVLGLQFGPFAVTGCELVQLADLPGQALAFALNVGLLRAGCIERLRGVFPLSPTRREGRRIEARMRVEHGAHGRAARQALPRVLAVNIDQVVSGFTQLRNRCGAAVDPSAALALRVDRAAQQQRVGLREAGVVEPRGQAGRRIELGADLGARSAFAHHAGISPAAECKLQGVDQDRLARAGLTGQHREAGSEFHVKRTDDDEVAQRQAQPHDQAAPLGVPEPEFQCSLRRSVA